MTTGRENPEELDAAARVVAGSDSNTASRSRFGRPLSSCARVGSGRARAAPFILPSAVSLRSAAVSLFHSLLCSRCASPCTSTTSRYVRPPPRALDRKRDRFSCVQFARAQKKVGVIIAGATCTTPEWFARSDSTVHALKHDCWRLQCKG